MSFGLTNAPSMFQELMDNLFAGKHKEYVLPYLDDIIVFSNSLEEHRKHVEVVLHMIKRANISLKLSKCEFYKKEIKILGNIVSQGCVKPDPDKILALKDFKKPEKINELRSFLGLANQTRSYIPKFAELSEPLSSLLKGHTKRSKKTITWSEKETAAFKHLKHHIINNTMRAQPDFSKPFILQTDALENALGAILGQYNNHGEFKMIYGWSRVLTSCEKNYSITDKELLAIVAGVKKFRHYLLGSFL